jgi:hypothetical protein
MCAMHAMWFLRVATPAHEAGSAFSLVDCIL